MQWLGIETRSFNVGQYRRQLTGPHTHEFFDHTNAEANEMRKQAAVSALIDMVQWFNSPPTRSSSPSSDGSLRLDISHTSSDFDESPVQKTKVAIYDATNSQLSRRELVQEFCDQNNVKTMFIESICNDPELILRNIKDVKLKSPDYLNVDSDLAAKDFIERIKHYEDAYEPVDCAHSESHLSFVKLIDVGTQVIINRIHGYLQSRIVYYLINLNISPKTIYISRHGESEFNLQGKIGGDSPLSQRGQQFATKLPELIDSLLSEDEKRQLVIWTSTLQRTIQTAQNLPYPKLQWKALDEIDAGVCDGSTYAEIQEMFPDDFEERDKDKFHYRYRGGESYADLVLRLDPILMTLETTPSCYIIAHQAVVRAIYSYFMSLPLSDLPYVHIPLHCVMAISLRAYGCDVKIIKADIEAVDTHRDGRSSAKQSPQSSYVPESKHLKRGSYGERGALNLAKLSLSPRDAHTTSSGSLEPTELHESSI